jgi:hypothetical protein
VKLTASLHRIIGLYVELYLHADGMMILKWALMKYDERLCSGFIWLRIETNDKVL